MMLLLESVLVILAVVALPRNEYRIIVMDNGSARESAADEARDDWPPIYELGCDSWYLSAELVPCVNTKSDAASTVVLIGDSIGAQWYSMLPEIYRMPDWRIVTLTKSACAMADIDYFYKPVGREYHECSNWRDQALDYIESIEPDLIFVGSASTYDFSEHEWTYGSSRVLARLSSAARKVVVISGTPRLSFDGPGCLGSSSQSSGCSETLADRESREVFQILSSVAEDFRNTDVIDLTDLVCSGMKCSARNERGIVVFRDNSHITDSFVLSSIPDLRSRLAAVDALPEVTVRVD